MNLLTTLTNIFTRGNDLAAQIRQHQQDCIGFEVIEKLPRGGYAVAVIIKTEWDSSVWNMQDHTWGDWCYRIKYLSNGQETWVSADVLTLTGTFYNDLSEPFKHLGYSDFSVDLNITPNF